MTDHMKYRAKINAKGLDTTGVTEDHARRMASTLGSHHLMVVEARATTVITDEEGNQQVALVLTQVEPVPDAQEDTVREFLRALYRQRPDQQGQAVLTGVSDGPSIADATRALSSQVERDADGEPAGVWDGDLDSPLAPLGCAFPGCTLQSEHDGDHHLEEDPEEAEDPDEEALASYADEQAGAQQEGPVTTTEPVGQVVEFSGKARRG